MKALLKILKFITSRFFFLSLILVAQIAAVIYFCYAITINLDIGFIYLFIVFVLNIPVIIFIINSKASTPYKFGWILIVSVMPGGGILFYCLFANKRDTKKQRAKIKPYVDYIAELNKDSSILNEIEKIDKDGYLHTKYIYNKSKNLPFKNSEVTYFEIGEKAWPCLIEELKKAKHYIFMEYFIIQEGKFWDSILEVLKEKVKEGLEIKILYDDFGCMTKLDYSYYKKLRKFGIDAHVYERYMPFLDVKMNNRDHRKICVIDGHTSFTGGMNLADEYVNEEQRFGIWKDTMIMIKGEGTNGLLQLFLSMWNKYLKRNDKYEDYYFEKYKHELEQIKPSGYVQPYGDIPFDYESVGENVYVNLINKAEHYIYISSPYLILDTYIFTALMSAVRSGVDVRILIPGVPDKKIVYSLGKSYAYRLALLGAKIYFYTPGFNHAKIFCVDDKFASLGTINLDLRSFYLNFENNVLLFNCECIKDIKNDFEKMFSISTDAKLTKKPNIFKKLWWAILTCFSPMF